MSETKPNWRYIKRMCNLPRVLDVQDASDTVTRTVTDRVENSGCPIIFISRISKVQKIKTIEYCKLLFGNFYDNWTKGNKSEELNFNLRKVKSTMSISVEIYFPNGRVYNLFYIGTPVSFVFIKTTWSNHLMSFFPPNVHHFYILLFARNNKEAMLVKNRIGFQIFVWVWWNL